MSVKKLQVAQALSELGFMVVEEEKKKTQKVRINNFCLSSCTLICHVERQAESSEKMQTEVPLVATVWDTLQNLEQQTLNDGPALAK